MQRIIGIGQGIEATSIVLLKGGNCDESFRKGRKQKKWLGSC
jgi:hypothetical protein